MSNYNKQNIDAYNKAYEEMYNKGKTREIPDPVLAVVTNRYFKKLFKDARVLDIGCGTGVDSFYLARKGFDVVGIDPAPYAIKIATKVKKKSDNNLSTTFLNLGVQELNKLNRKFDIVIAMSSLYYLNNNDQKDAVQNIANILNPNGLLFVALPEKFEGANIDDNGFFYNSNMVTMTKKYDMDDIHDLFNSRFCTFVFGRGGYSDFGDPFQENGFIHWYVLMEKRGQDD